MPADFSERLNGVFGLILTPPDEHGLRRPYTTAEVAEVFRIRHEEGRAPRTISKARLDQLRNQRGNNPTHDVMRTIAGAFAELARRTMPPDAAIDESATDAITWCLIADSSIATALASQVAQLARSLVGKPYRPGASGPDAFDAPGLTRAAWRAGDVVLPETLSEQARFGERVPLTLAAPGDLLLFSADGSVAGVHHVALYIGDGELIEAHPEAGVRQRRVILPTQSRAGEDALLDFVQRIDRATTILNEFRSLSQQRDAPTSRGVMARYETLTDDEQQAVRELIDVIIEAKTKRNTLFDRFSRRRKQD